MAEITHLPGDCSVGNIIDSVETDGAVIVDDFVTGEWLDEFNAAVETSIRDYKPYDYGEPEAVEFLGKHTVRHRRHP